MKTIATIFLIFLSFEAHAADTKKAAATGATVEKVLEFYQTAGFLDDCLQHVEDAVDRRRKDFALEDALAKRIKDIAARIYVKKNLFNVFKIAYAKQTTLENMTALWEWMNTPAGIRLRKAYAEHYKDKSSFKDWRLYYERESPAILRPNRRNALNTVITSSEQAELETTKTLGGDFAVWWTINQTQPEKDSMKHIKAQIKPRKSAYMEAAREYYGVYDFALFREMKNEEIDEISKFASTATGQGATKAYRAALEQALDGAAKTLTNEIVKGTK